MTSPTRCIFVTPPTRVSVSTTKKGAWTGAFGVLRSRNCQIGTLSTLSAAVSMAASTFSSASSAELPATGMIDTTAPTTDAAEPTTRIGVVAILVRKQPLSKDANRAIEASLVIVFMRYSLISDCYIENHNRPRIGRAHV